MRKGFTREPQRDDPSTRGKNYITPGGLQRLKEEHRFLLIRDRPVLYYKISHFQHSNFKIQPYASKHIKVFICAC